MASLNAGAARLRAMTTDETSVGLTVQTVKFAGQEWSQFGNMYNSYMYEDIKDEFPQF